MSTHLTKYCEKTNCTFEPVESENIEKGSLDDDVTTRSPFWREKGFSREAFESKDFYGWKTTASPYSSHVPTRSYGQQQLSSGGYFDDDYPLSTVGHLWPSMRTSTTERPFLSVLFARGKNVSNSKPASPPPPPPMTTTTTLPHHDHHHRIHHHHHYPTAPTPTTTTKTLPPLPLHTNTNTNTPTTTITSITTKPLCPSASITTTITHLHRHRTTTTTANTTTTTTNTTTITTSTTTITTTTNTNTTVFSSK
ncbi:unnamed protein product [Nesidiocoris tenuis]|uniref:Uncharacterized protein n=1 Tax=Nesidiocoris tenuis TaxID=355587 RepID=A0A6H5FUB9_9HEMI|nr:unnamed protein product [Nesidiocoris tenuis]